MVPQPQSKSKQPHPPALLPAGGAAAPRSQACIDPDPASVWWQAFPHPEKKVQFAAVKDLQVLRGLQQQWDNSPPSPEAVQLCQRPEHQMLKTNTKMTPKGATSPLRGATASVCLTKDDIPGAKRPKRSPEEYNCWMLRRWLQCRGRTSGKKAALVQR